MAGIILALWASLVSAELAKMPVGNLSCFYCFKVKRATQCLPIACHASERVCISHEVVLYAKPKVKVLISKKCATRCPNSNSLFEWSPVFRMKGKIIRQCCSRNLCNMAPTSQEGLWALPGGLLLPVGLGLLRILM
ncbi:lymphocyte antigen 6L [Castor canadensis]|uniref:Lymphocyte antigen 6L n=1 Tax=Castor canadensis TaxID=51338 RepID=A0A8C0VVZ0_CASCN|nr:lymphocyte antigen 6L [Castor canadensis]